MNQLLEARPQPEPISGPIRVAGDPEMAALCTRLRYGREHIDAISQEFERIADQIETISSGNRVSLPPMAIEKARQVNRSLDAARSSLQVLLAVFGIDFCRPNPR